MANLIKIDSKVVVLLNNGNYIEKDNISAELVNKLVSAKTDEDIVKLLDDNYNAKIKEIKSIDSFINQVKKSKILSYRNNCVYMKGISKLSLPKDLAERIIKAEKEKDSNKLESYKNFWILMSLNPDKECRENLFWFLQKYGMTISKHGFFVGYRNVDTTSTPGIFTDYYTHTFKIKIGEVVSMKRKDCDSDSNITCSKGLHVAGKGWLKRNYYGSTGIACLVNPADVVAVPKNDNYGKLRTCAYLPMQTINYDIMGEVVPLNIEDGFDCGFVSKVIYEGLLADNDSEYKIEIPKLPTSSKLKIKKSLLDIASNCIKNRKL